MNRRSRSMHDMEQQQEILITLERSVGVSGADTLQEWVNRAMKDRIPAHETRCALIRGVETLRHRLMSSDFGMPDFLLRIDSVLACLEMSSGIEDVGSLPDTPIVIGVVKGDPHDLGKNIIAGIYRAYGYRVFDLGRDVSLDAFVQGVALNKAKILGISAMMSTTMPAMKDIIRDVKAAYPDTKVIVGGAPLNEVLARSYGADAYVESAVSVIEQTLTLLDTG
jgi:dimethylamine corrinoid protein